MEEMGHSCELWYAQEHVFSLRAYVTTALSRFPVGHAMDPHQTQRVERLMGLIIRSTLHSTRWDSVADADARAHYKHGRGSSKRAKSLQRFSSLSRALKKFTEYPPQNFPLSKKAFLLKMHRTEHKRTSKNNMDNPFCTSVVARLLPCGSGEISQ